MSRRQARQTDSAANVSSNHHRWQAAADGCSCERQSSSPAVIRTSRNAMYCDLSLTSRSGSAVPPAAGAFRAAVWLMALGGANVWCVSLIKSERSGELLRATRAIEHIVSCLHSGVRPQVEQSSEVQCRALQRCDGLRGRLAVAELVAVTVKPARPARDHCAHIALPSCRCWEDEADSQSQALGASGLPLSRSAVICLLDRAAHTPLLLRHFHSADQRFGHCHPPLTRPTRRSRGVGVGVGCPDGMV